MAAPQTPLGNGGGKKREVLRTPSRELVGKLDREIDAHLRMQEREGKVFTPSGQRIRDLLDRTREEGG